MTCCRCDKEFKTGERVFEYSSGTYNAEDNLILPDEHLKAYCEDCDLEWGADD
jgi:hypothetical protein